MKITIKNIKLKELPELIESEDYKNWPFVPISNIRATSHYNNPHAHKEDYCLFLAYDAEKFIGYLGALSDQMFVTDTPQKVYWLSCMWVLPEYRKHGVATQLLKHAYEIFDGNVLITNFIPQSKKAFDKTEQYHTLTNLEGIRVYVRLDLQHILPRKNKNLTWLRPVLWFLDVFFNLFINLRLFIFVSFNSPKSIYSTSQSPDTKIKDYIINSVKDSLFRRGFEELQWMLEYPWVKQVKRISKDAKRYYFSQEGKDFHQDFITIYNNNKVVGWMLLTLYRGELKIPYLFYKEDNWDDIAKFLGKYLAKHKIKTLVSYYHNLNKAISSKKYFIHKRNASYGFLISKTLQRKCTLENPIVYYGDGDGGFT